MVSAITLLVISALAGLFTSWFNFCIGSPEVDIHDTWFISNDSVIFRKYGEWLCRKQTYFQIRHEDSDKDPLSPYKAMGLCDVCTSFWVFFAISVFACALGYFSPATFFLFPLFVPVAAHVARLTSLG